MTWLLPVMLALATRRITVLLVRDELSLVKVPRDAIAHWLDPRDEPPCSLTRRKEKT